MGESPDKLAEALREWERVRDQIKNNGKAFLRAEDTEALEWFWWNHGCVVANAACEIPTLRADRDALAARVATLTGALGGYQDEHSWRAKVRHCGCHLCQQARAALAAPAPSVPDA